VYCVSLERRDKIMRGIVDLTHAQRLPGDARSPRAIWARAARNLHLPGRPLSWAVTGFAAGTLFWFTAGSWSSGAESNVERAAAAARGAAPSCVALMLDRSTGRTHTRPCDTNAAPLPLATASGKEDLALLPQWSQRTISPHSTANENAPPQTE
jgi:hypothetical protein